MGRRLREEEVMTIGVLHERGSSNRAIARQLDVDEKGVRYRRDLSRSFGSRALQTLHVEVHNAEKLPHRWGF